MLIYGIIEVPPRYMNRSVSDINLHIIFRSWNMWFQAQFLGISQSLTSNMNCGYKTEWRDSYVAEKAVILIVSFWPGSKVSLFGNILKQPSSSFKPDRVPPAWSSQLNLRKRSEHKGKHRPHMPLEQIGVDPCKYEITFSWALKKSNIRK